MIRSYSPHLCLWFAFAVFTFITVASVHAVPITTTNLAITASGNTVTTVNPSTVITLTATVTTAGAPATSGQVAFCDANAAACTDIHLLGTAQIQPDGTATLKFIPPPGSHLYKAVATLGGVAYASSSVPPSVSPPSPLYSSSLTVTGSSGSPLLATVSGTGPTVPTGTVTFSNSLSPSLGGSVTLSGGSVTQRVDSSERDLSSLDVPVLFKTADFNNDGKTDLLASFSPSTLNTGAAPSLVYLSGSFYSPLTASIPNGCISAATADFNSDGKTDIAVFVNGASGPGLLTGHGDGTFSGPSFAAGAACNPILTSDFNMDGQPDVAVLNTNEVDIWFGASNGTFAAGPALSTSAAQYIQVGDFDGDGIPDLAVADASTVNIFLNQGTGTFGSPGVPTQASFKTMLAADLNNDGKSDLATGTNIVLLSKGDGTFSSQTITIPNGSTSTSYVGDFNGDGKTDLAFLYGGSNTNNTVLFGTVCPGLGDGTFECPASYDVFTPGNIIIPPTYQYGDYAFDYVPNVATTMDMNGDGVADLYMGLKVNGLSRSGAPDLTAGLEYESLATVTSSSSSASFPGIVSVPSSSDLYAKYSGDAFYEPGASVNVDISSYPISILNLSVDDANPFFGQSITLTATLTPYSGTGFSTDGETVSFNCGEVLTLTATLHSGVAAVTTSSLPSGGISCRANFAGDTHFASALSPSAAVTVQSGTSLLAFSIPNHNYGDTFTLSATSPSPGSISYSNIRGPATLNGMTVTVTGLGQVTLQAALAASGQYPAATQAATFTAAPANLFITANNAARVYGGANPVFTGTINGARFNDGSALAESFSTTANAASPVGSYSIIPSVTGPAIGNYSINVGNGTLVVSQAGSATTLSISNNNTSLTANVVSLTSGTPTGTVTFLAGQTTLGKAVISNGTATLSGVNIFSGNVVISAQYSGDANFTQSAAPPIFPFAFSIPNHTYGDTFTLSATSPSPGAISYSNISGPATLNGTTVTVTGLGQVTLHAALAASGQYPAATRAATFTAAPANLSITANNAARVYGGANPVFTGTINGARFNDGSALTESFSTTANAASPVGSYSIVPSIAGPAIGNYSINVGNGTLVVSQAGSATTFSLSNDNTSLTANVVSLTSGTPTGTVTFLAGQTTLGKATVNNGTATLSGVNIFSGNVVISAQYSGDANFTQSAAPPIFPFAVTPANGTLTTSTSGTVTDTFTLGTIPGYSGSVQLSCTGLPTNATCTFNPPSVTFGSSAWVQSTVTITTGITASASFGDNHAPQFAAVVGAPALFSFLYLRRRRTPLRDLILPVLLLLVSTTMVSACGGERAATSTPSSTTATPSGTYTVNVVATGAGGLALTTPLVLTVN